ncbi:MAG: TRAP transporter large permease subunit, partial [Defluviitaleaceae bacterium]|nr:TRAP transporter large permease subunit [Defluviitaleaceae bacterium]
MIVLTIPIFYPVVVGALGYDPIWFGVIIVMVVGLAEASPPVGMNVFILRGIAQDISIETIFRGLWPFMVGMLILIAILIAFPSIATFLPNLLIE